MTSRAGEEKTIRSTDLTQKVDIVIGNVEQITCKSFIGVAMSVEGEPLEVNETCSSTIVVIHPDTDKRIVLESIDALMDELLNITKALVEGAI